MTAAAIARQCGILPPDMPLPYIAPVMATMDEPAGARASTSADAHRARAEAEAARPAHADRARSDAGPASSSEPGAAGNTSASRAAGRGLHAAFRVRCLALLQRVCCLGSCCFWSCINGMMAVFYCITFLFLTQKHRCW